MATVLLVEDEDTLRESVARYLEFEGHSVLTAANGREAFEVGVSGQPDVLVADWMLRNHIHGLHVAQTLRVVDPALNTVLITGFPSRDLEQEFESGGVTQMLEKPFDLTALNEAVLEAVDAEPGGGSSPAAVLEFSREGKLDFASGRARELLAETDADVDVSDAAAIFGDFESVFEGALEEWSAYEPPGSASPWMVRTRPRGNGAGWLVALCREDEPRWLSDPRLRILLDHHSRSSPVLPDLGPVIVLERDGAVRRLLASQVERIGALCYLADDAAAALRLLTAEPRAQTILIDIETAGSELATWVASIHKARPGARVIGTGGMGDESELLAVGLSRLLAKPWRIDELVDALAAGRPN